MICPECNGEFRDGFTRCNDCDVDLVDALPQSGDRDDHDVRLMRVFETKDPGLVAIVRSLLDDAQIEFVTNAEDLQYLFYSGLPVTNGVEFWVREDDLEEARALLAELES
ncbi:MAG: DUF2007 domain-containing protein [Acidobacteriota bacterium]|nr:DUF2007 domain-containing protein [Acidobacteriota bacterium]